MPTYVTLIRFVSKGPESITDFGTAWERTAKTIADAGIDITGVYGLLGPYDMMLLYDAEDQKSAARVPLTIGSIQHGIKTETWSTIPLEEFVKLPGQLRGK